MARSGAHLCSLSAAPPAGPLARCQTPHQPPRHGLGSRADPAPTSRSVPARPLRARTLYRAYARRISVSGFWDWIGILKLKIGAGADLGEAIRNPVGVQPSRHGIVVVGAYLACCARSGTAPWQPRGRVATRSRCLDLSWTAAPDATSYGAGLTGHPSAARMTGRPATSRGSQTGHGRTRDRLGPSIKWL